MQFINNMSIGGKLRAAFGVLLLLLIFLAFFAYSRLSLVQSESRNISQNWMPSSATANAMTGDLAEYRVGVLQMLSATDAERIQTGTQNMEKAAGELKGHLQDYEKLVNPGEESKLFDSLKPVLASYQEQGGRMVKAVRAGQIDEARVIQAKDARPKILEASRLLNSLVDLNKKGAAASATRSEDIYGSAVTWLVVVALLACGTAMVLVWVLIRNITGPLARAVQAADRVAAGDLSQAIEFTGKDEVARLLESMQRMQTSLVGTVGSVRSGADSVATASAQIAQGNADLSARTEEQASSLEETSATMEQLNATVRQTADNAAAADQLAKSASQTARDGGQVVGEVVSTMRGIEDSSKRISDIIAVIDGIAFRPISWR